MRRSQAPAGGAVVVSSTDLRVRRGKACSVPVRRFARREGALPRRDPARERRLGLVPAKTVRVVRRQPRPIRAGEIGRLGGMRFVPDRQVRDEIGGAHRLVESQRERHDVVDAAGLARPSRRNQPDGGRGERERVGRAERVSCGARRRRIDRHRVGGGVRQGRVRVGRQQQNRRPRPAERAFDRWGDAHPGRRRIRRDAAERHHRLGEHDADLVGVLELADLAGRAGLEDRERRGLGERRPGRNGQHGGGGQIRGATSHVVLPRVTRAPRRTPGRRASRTRRAS